MWIFSTALAGASFGNTGQIIRYRPTADKTTQSAVLSLPSGVNVTNTKPSAALYASRLYLTGIATDNLLVDENFRVLRQGIAPPITVPTATATTGPGRTGSCVVAIAFYDELTDEWSPLSAQSAAVTLANQACVTGSIPTTSQDARVSHVGVWVSMDGGAFRLATMRQLGVSSITEAVPTLTLGAAFFDDFERLPRGSINAIYHDRQCVAGVFGSEDTVYVSAPFRPERYEGLSFKTRNGDAIVGMVAVRDILLVMTGGSAYALRGYTEDDMSLSLIDEDIGAINHHGIVVIHGNAWVPSNKTIFLYNGAFHDICKDRRTEWEDAYADNETAFNNSFAVHDPNEYTYTLYINYSDTNIPDPDEVTPQTVAWVASYKDMVPELSGGFGQPDWSMDVMRRSTDSAALLKLPDGKRGDVHLGSCDGTVRVKDSTDTDDDGDTYGKLCWIRTMHYQFSDPGGDTLEGKTFNSSHSYFESEYSAWTLYVKAGDEEAYRQKTPDNTTYFWKDDVAASRISSGGTTYLPKTVHSHSPQRCSGRGVTLEYKIPSGDRFKWYGFGGTYVPGPTSRGVETANPPV